MALVLLSKQDDYDLTHSDHDCRGWTVNDTAGNRLGKCTDMVIDTEAEHVDSIILDNGAQIPAADIALRDGAVLVRGVGGAMRETTTTTTETTRRDTGAAGDVTLPVIEERIAVDKRQVDRGGVRVEQHVTERPVEETVSLREEHVTVERRPANQPVDATNMEAFKEGVIEVTEMGEEAVVSKQARVVEEVVVGKEVTEHQETLRDTVRRTDVEVEQLDADTSTKANTGGRRG
ncbi:MAG: YsnF/AvaK domain-containing protein [Acidobacteriota bacterium]|nr:YsnF/AvaK domain-containing protein [Acidobacteriota bacterium]